MTAQTDQKADQDLVEIVYQMRECLRRGAEECRDVLQNLVQAAHLRESAMAAERIEHEFRHILRIMGREIFAAALIDLRTSDGLDDLDLYFWPGYDSILQSDSKRRITLRDEFLLPSGIGHVGHMRSEYLTTPANRWFQRVLAARDSRQASRMVFQPGSTHRWLTAGPIQIVPIKQSLVCLSVALSNHDHVASSSGIARICLNSESWHEWGRTLSRFLNDRTGINSASPWPVAVARGESAEIAARVHTLREYLYSVWLGACFRPNFFVDPCMKELIEEQVKAEMHAEDLDFTWLCDFLQDDFFENESAETVNDAPKTGQQSPNTSGINDTDEHEHTYRYWYSLPLDSVASAKDEDCELGSAMFLSNRGLSEAFLFMSASWISKIFMSLRGFENTLKVAELSREAGEIRGQLGNQALMAHEMKSIAQGLARNVIIKPDDNTAAAVVGIDTNAELAGREWGIAPLPELIVAAGTIIKLWCGHENPHDFFKTTPILPLSLQEIVLACWDAARDAMKPYACKGLPLQQPVNLRIATRTLHELEKIWCDESIQVTVDPASPRPDWEQHAGAWMNVTRFLVSSFINSIRHGVPGSQKVECLASEATLIIKISDTRSFGRDDFRDLIDDPIVRENIIKGRTKVEITPIAAESATGETVREKLACALETETSMHPRGRDPEPGEPFSIIIPIPLRLLRTAGDNLGVAL